MSLWSRLFNARPKPPDNSGAVAGQMQPFQGLSTYAPGNMYMYNQYWFSPILAQNKFNSWVAICANMNAYTSTRVRAQVYVKKRGDKKRLFNSRGLDRSEFRYLATYASNRVRNAALAMGMEDMEVLTEEHQALALMHTPNPYWAGMDFQALRFLYYQIFGNVFIYKQRDAAGQVISLWPLPPQFCMLLRNFEKGDGEGAPIWGVRFSGQRSWDIPMEDVIHIRRPNIKGNIYLGTGIVEEAWPGLQLHEQKRSMDQNLAGKGFLNPSVVFMGGSPTQEQLNGFVSDLMNRLRSPDNFGIVAVAQDPEKVKVEQLADRGTISNLTLGTPKDVVMEIAKHFGVPMSKIYDDNANYASSVQADNSYYEMTILPLLRADEAAFNDQLLADFDDTGDAMIAYPSILAEDREMALKINQELTTAATAGIITPEEAKAQRIQVRV